MKTKSIYTGSERARLRRLRVRELRHAIAQADYDDITREIAAIERQARERAQKEK